MLPAAATAKALCGVCERRHSIYTCPRCATRTCSLPCSKSHKTLRSCSGERDKTAYVPMNKYNWGIMANDYIYLEEIGRKTAEWGYDIVKGGYLANATISGRGRGRGRGRGAGSIPRGSGRGKRESLKTQFDALDIDMEILPPGMERRRLNQSTWDARSKSPLMTMEFVFHPVKDPLAPSISPVPSSFTLLTHRNSLNLTLLDTIRRHIEERGKKDAIPAWVKSLVSPAEEGEWTPPIYLMIQHSSSSSHPISRVYHKLDSTSNISSILRHKSFVEYPTINVWQDGAFNGALVETDGTFVKGEDEPPPARRRRLDAAGGRKIIKSLLGEYKSDEDEETKEEENVLDMLGNYGSEEEQENAEAALESDLDEDIDKEDAGDGEPAAPTLEDLRELFDPYLTDDHLPHPGLEDEDMVDWGDSADDEADELDQALTRQRALFQSHR